MVTFCASIVFKYPFTFFNFFFETSGVIFNNMLLLKTCVKSLKIGTYDELNSRQCGLLLQLDNSRWDVVKNGNN